MFKWYFYVVYGGFFANQSRLLADNVTLHSDPNVVTLSPETNDGKKVTT